MLRGGPAWARRASRDPYSEFLSRNKRLALIADAVLAETTALAGLGSRDALLEAARRTREELSARAREREQRDGVLARLRRAPRVIDKPAIQALALACRAAELTLHRTPWHHQVVGAVLLHDGLIMETPNGAGKTLIAALAACLNGLTGKSTHIVTHNDYLAERDTRWMGPLYTSLGLSVGIVFTDQSVELLRGVLDPDGVTLRAASREASAAPATEAVNDSAEDGGADTKSASAPAPPPERLPHEANGAVVVDSTLTLKRVFESDVVYGRIESFGFPYLADHQVTTPGTEVSGRRDMLIVDECDAVLLDDLRTPLILSEPVPALAAAPAVLARLDELARALRRDVDFTVEGDIQITYEGLSRIRELTGVDFYSPEACGLAHGLVVALQANHAYQRDVHYLVAGADLVIIHQASGRLLFGRQFGDGLDEAIRVKEGLPVGTRLQSHPVAKITINNFVKTYDGVAGMSGAIGDPAEYRRFYGVGTVRVDPFPRSRRDLPDAVLKTKREARQSLLVEAIERAVRGQPVLVNVPAPADVDALLKLLQPSERQTLQARGVDIRVLDARNLSEEAEIVAQAGTAGRITVCSKVAARGTDIVIDPAAAAAGGLCVLGLERGFDRRHDDQLRGRAGRHGDPGDALFFLSYEDDLLRVFGSARLKTVMERLGMEEGERIEHPLVTLSIRTAQRRIHAYERNRRLRVVELDDVMERHRSVFYDVRHRILYASDMNPELLAMLDNWVHHRTRAVQRAMRDDPVVRAEDLFGPIARTMEDTEVTRILRIRDQKIQRRALREAVGRGLTGLDPERIRLVTLGELDSGWKRYLGREDFARDETDLAGSELDVKSELYVGRMEDAFDAFFYEVGEWVIAALRTREPLPPAIVEAASPHA